MCWLHLQRQGQSVQPAQDETPSPPQRLAGDIQMKIGSALKEGVDCDLCFEASERSAKTEVCTKAECEVPVILPRNVERLRVSEDCFVPVRRADHSEYNFATPDSCPPNDQILSREPLRRHEHRRGVSQQFLNCQVDQRGIAA